MEGNTRRGSPAGFSSLFPGASLGRLDSLHEPMGRSSAFWGTPWCSFGAIGGRTTAARERHTSRTPRVQLAWESSTLLRVGGAPGVRPERVASLALVRAA